MSARAKDSSAKSEAKANAPRLGGAVVQISEEASEAIGEKTRSARDKSISARGFARIIRTNHACAAIMACLPGVNRAHQSDRDKVIVIYVPPDIELARILFGKVIPARPECALRLGSIS